MSFNPPRPPATMKSPDDTKRQAIRYMVDRYKRKRTEGGIMLKIILWIVGILILLGIGYIAIIAQGWKGVS